MRRWEIIVLAVATAALGGWWAAKHWAACRSGCEPSARGGLVFDRIWIDQLPTNPKQTVNVFGADSSERRGIFLSTSQWKGSYEIFIHQGGDAGLVLAFPQTGEKENVAVRAWKCRERDMDYCLELSGSSRGVKRYRSQEGWEIGAATGPEQLLERVEAIVRAGP